MRSFLCLAVWAGGLFDLWWFGCCGHLIGESAIAEHLSVLWLMFSQCF